MKKLIYFFCFMMGTSPIFSELQIEEMWKLTQSATTLSGIKSNGISAFSDSPAANLAYFNAHSGWATAIDSSEFMQVQYISGRWILAKPSWAFDVFLKRGGIQDLNEIIETNGELSLSGNSFNYELNTIGIGTAYHLPYMPLYLGLTSKIIQGKLADETVNGASFDVSAILDAGPIELGLLAENVAESQIEWENKKETLSSPYHLSAKYKGKHWGLLAETSLNNDTEDWHTNAYYRLPLSGLELPINIGISNIGTHFGLGIGLGKLNLSYALTVLDDTYGGESLHQFGVYIFIEKQRPTPKPKKQAPKAIAAPTLYFVPSDMTYHPNKEMVSALIENNKLPKYDPFQPSKVITRLELANLVEKAFSIPAMSQITKIQDVPEENPSYKTIQAVIHANILTLDKNGNYRPNQPVTRAVAAVVFSRLIGQPQPNNNDNDSTPYEDIPEKAWYRAAVNNLVKQNILTGEGPFSGNTYFTRIEWANWLNCYTQPKNQ